MNGDNPMKEETLRLIKEIEDNPVLNQRVLSQKLNISLGKTNYLLRELTKKGIVKMRSFSRSTKKAKKLRYILTTKGMEEKIKLTYYFLQVKEKEYNRLRREYERYCAGQKNGDSHIRGGVA